MGKYYASNCQQRTVEKPGSENNGNVFIECELIDMNYDFNDPVKHFFFLGSNQSLIDKYIAMIDSKGIMVDPVTGDVKQWRGTKVQVEAPTPFYKKHFRTRVTRRGKVEKGDYVKDANGNPQLFSKQTVFCMQYEDEDGTICFADRNMPDEVFGNMMRDIFVPAVEVPHPTIEGKTLWVTPEEAGIEVPKPPVTPTQPVTPPEGSGPVPPAGGPAPIYNKDKTAIFNPTTGTWEPVTQ